MYKNYYNYKKKNNFKNNKISFKFKLLKKMRRKI